MLERKEKRKRKLWVIIDPFVNKLHAFNLIANSASVASLQQDSPLLCSISSGKILVQFTIISYLRSQYQDDCEYSWFNHVFDRDSRANPEKATAIHSGTLAWKIPRTEEPGGLQSMGSLRVGHDWMTSLSLFTFLNWRRKWQPTPVFLPGESQGRGSLVGCCLWGRTESGATEMI